MELTKAGSILLACLYVVLVSCTVSGRDYWEQTLQIRADKVTQGDTYQCIATPIHDLAGQYVVGFKLNASIENIHHMALAFCGQYNANQSIWDCYHQQGDVCIGASKDVSGYNGGGMENNNFVFMYPEDVGIKIGRDTGFYNLVSQVHFKNPNKGPTIAGTLTLFIAHSAAMRYNTFSTTLSGYIPANTQEFSAETACKWRGVEVFPYSFDTHTHERDTVDLSTNNDQITFPSYFVEGYRIRNGTWTLIGQGGTHIDDGKIQNEDAKYGSTFTIIPGDVIKRNYELRLKEQRYKKGDQVWLYTPIRINLVREDHPSSNPFGGGPYVIVDALGDVTFRVRAPEGKATRCLFNNNSDEKVETGLDHASEMCNFGIKFKYRPEDESVYYRGPMCQSNIQTFDWCSMEETMARCQRH